MNQREKSLSIIFAWAWILTVLIALRLHDDSKKQWWRFDGFAIEFNRPTGETSLYNTSGIYMTNISVSFSTSTEKIERREKLWNRNIKATKQ